VNCIGYSIKAALCVVGLLGALFVGHFSLPPQHTDEVEGALPSHVCFLCAVSQLRGRRTGEGDGRESEAF
jgi:hypothetical protein